MNAPSATDAKQVRGSIRDGFVAALLIFAVAFFGEFLIYRRASRAIFDGVRTELQELVTVAAAQVDGDLHRTLTSPEQMGSSEHLAALHPLVRFHRATRDLIYVYSAILDGDSVRFVLGTDYLYRPFDDTLPADKIMQAYTGNDQSLRQALVEQRVLVQERPIREAHRSYLSAFAPFLDRHGNVVGVVGVDMWTRQLDERLRGIRRAALVGVIAVALLSIVAGVIVAGLRWKQATAAARDAAMARALAEQKAKAELAAAQAERHAEEAEAASRAKGTFLATMSHEIRTPLHGILGMAELMQHTTLSTQQRDYLGTIESSGKSLVRIIDDVLDFSKIEAGRVQLERRPFPFKTTIAEVVRLLSHRAVAKGIALQVDIASSAPDAMLGDVNRFKQILYNLIGNAIKFTRVGSVVIRAYVENERAVRICIADTGIGIAPEKLGSLFKMFSQADGSTSREYGGTGLGLAISQRLAQLMGGDITVTSTPQVGSEFMVTLPLDRVLDRRTPSGANTNPALETIEL